MINITSLSIVSSALLIALNIFWSIHLLHSGFCVSRRTTNSTDSSAPRIAIQTPGCSNCPEVANQISTAITTPSEVFQSLSTLAFDLVDFDVGRFDNRRLYKMYDFALVGDKFAEASASSLVCLASQTSVERLHSLAQVARQWQGPISVSAFVAGNEEFSVLQYYVTYLRMCFQFIRDNVTFHLAVPAKMQPQHEARGLTDLTNRFDCKYPEKTLHKLLSLRTAETIKWRLKNEYPQNHMRNLARKGCQNKYVFLTDIDIIPSRDIVALLNRFLQSVTCSGKCAYVIPTFEIDIRAKYPSSKMELIRLHKKGLARPFHEKVFIYNQYATNFSSWIASSWKNDPIFISHNVTNFEFLYEPFYIALDNVPAHDERFLGYGFTRNSQVYEMYVAGYSFHVLSPVFTCHWGLQQKKTRPVWREQQNNMNRKRFETFKSEIFARYKNDPLLMFNIKKEKRGRFVTTDGAKYRDLKLAEVAVALNAIGGAYKESGKWRKYWCDLRQNTRAKYSTYKDAASKSGINGPRSHKPLTELEERIVAVISRQAVDGDPVDTLGFQPIVSNELNANMVGPNNGAAESPLLQLSPQIAEQTAAEAELEVLQEIPPASVRRRRAPKRKAPDAELRNIAVMERESIALKKQKIELKKAELKVKERELAIREAELEEFKEIKTSLSKIQALMRARIHIL